MSDPANANRPHVFLRALFVWLVLIEVEFVHGILRTIFLMPVVDNFRSRQISVFTGSVLILAVAYALVPSLHTIEKKSLISIGLLWVVLTVAFEFGFGHFVFGRSWADLASDYNPFRGGFLLIGMAVLMLSPIVAAWLRRL